MKRIARRPVRIVVTGAVAVGVALTLSGCVLASPTEAGTPYAASDGSEATITDPATNSTIKLENFLVVASAKGQPASVVGAVVNTGKTDVTVELSLSDQGSSSLAEASVAASPNKIAQVGPSGTAMTVSSIPQPPGSVLTLAARTTGGGTVRFTVPVLPATGEYATLTPTATPSASATS